MMPETAAGNVMTGQGDGCRLPRAASDAVLFGFLPMSLPLTFNPPITIDLCETAGREFGRARFEMQRALFEQELVAQLVALDEALRTADIDRDQALAAFDKAAWGAWEEPPAPEAAFQEQSRPVSSPWRWALPWNRETPLLDLFWRARL
jgi:hypothetical protein